MIVSSFIYVFIGGERVLPMARRVCPAIAIVVFALR
jgi:hypothetical protein